MRPVKDGRQEDEASRAKGADAFATGSCAA